MATRPDANGELGLSEGQVQAVIIASRVTACLSFCGSSMILFMSYRRYSLDKTKFNSFVQLMTCLSIADIFMSFALLWGAAAVPVEVQFPGFHGHGRGNTQTCEAQGFFINVTFVTSFLYNATIMIYLATAVVHGLKGRRIASKVYLRWAHSMILTISFSTGIAALCLNLINPVMGGLFGCSINSYPPYCQHDYTPYSCSRGPQDPFLAVVILTLVPAYLSVSTMYGSVLTIYIAAWRKSRNQRRFAFDESAKNAVESSIDKDVIEERRSSIIAMVTSNRQDSSEARFDVLQELKTQATLYAVAFANTHVYICVVGSLELAGVVTPFNTKHFFPLFFVAAICTPLQGFFSFLIFLRPDYNKTRRKLGEDVSSFEVLKEAIMCGQWHDGDARSTGGYT